MASNSSPQPCHIVAAYQALKKWRTMLYRLNATHHDMIQINGSHRLTEVHHIGDIIHLFIAASLLVAFFVSKFQITLKG